MALNELDKRFLKHIIYRSFLVDIADDHRGKSIDDQAEKIVDMYEYFCVLNKSQKESILKLNRLKIKED